MEEQKNEEKKENEAPRAVSAQDKDIEENKVLAALSYIGFLVLVPLLAKKDSPFCKFHAKQGLVMLIIFIVGCLIFWIPVIGWLIWIIAVVLDILALIQALQGKYWEIPVVGNWAKKLNL
jgi:uncharacterized membrane protein